MSSRATESADVRLSTQQFRQLENEMRLFSARTKVRGKNYARRGQVGPLFIEGNSIGASVRGTRRYEVRWTWDDGSWDPSCTCPVGYLCKHQYAVACRVLDLIAGQSSFDDDVEPRRASLPHPAEPDLPRTAGPSHASSQSQAATLSELRAARNSWSRREAFRQLLEENPRVSLSLYRPPFDDIFEERNFDFMCWLLADAVSRLAGGWVPSALEPYRERPDLEAIHRERSRDALVADLARWSRQGRAEPDRSLRFVFRLVQEGSLPASLAFEVRQTSKRLRDEPRTIGQLDQLLREVERSPGRLPALQVELLRIWLQAADVPGGWAPRGSVLTLSTVRRLLEAGADSGALVWDEQLDPALSERWGLTPGSPVRFDRQAAKVVPVCEAQGGRLTILLRVCWPDGRTRRLDEGLFLSETEFEAASTRGLLLCDGAWHVVTESPPGAILDRFFSTGDLTLAPGEHTPLLEQMSQRFPSMRDSLAPFTRVHEVEAVVALDLRQDDWMQIRVFAAPAGSVWKPLQPAAPGERVYEHVPGKQWAPLDGPAPREMELEAAANLREGTEEQRAAQAEPPGAANGSPRPVWLETLDLESLAPIVEWLARTGARDGTKGMPGGRSCTAPDRHVGWWLRLGPSRSAAFAEAWEQRPSGTRWYCTPAAKRLLEDPPPVRPSLRVEPAGVDWFRVSAEWEAEGLTLTDEDLAALRRASGPYVKISSGWVRRDVGAVAEQATETLADLGIEPGAGEQRLSVWQVSQAGPESLALLEELGADPGTSEAIRRLRAQVAAFRGLPKARVPRGFRGELRPYQQRGVDFLAYCSSLGLGAVLADDMGLGKTVQALAWLLWLRQREPELGPALVVCPASVVHNWAREAERFAPRLRVALLTSGRERQAVMRDAAGHDLLVTNYALMRRDIARWRTVPLGVAILDEAQNIKNPDAAVSRASLQLQARYRLALTGTPLENRALDLWSILAFANPGLLGARADFVSRYDRPDSPPHARRLLAARLRPVLLRRMKREAAPDLPERIEERRDCELLHGQRRLYLAELARSQALVEDLAARPDGLRRNRIQILAALTRLRQICCHPALAGGSTRLGSGKFVALWEILEPLLDEGHKVLVFSQFVRCLELLQGDLSRRGVVHHTLTGQTRDRERVVAAFQEDDNPGVFLVSLKAGGTGLNLTAASYVVLFDPWWNPAVEAQAIDRTHRIGQTRTVIAYRLLTLGTLEEKIWELQQRKAALAHDILGEDGFARALTREDLAFLLSPE